MIFFSKKKVNKFYVFSYLFFTVVQNFKPKRKEDLSWHVYLNVFNHIATFKNKLYKFLHMMGAITIFENIFKFSFVVTDW
jgi:hypothetical protein